MLRKRFLVLDRDSKFTDHFCEILTEAGVQIVRTAYQAPNMNAIAERWVQSVKTECLDKMILFGRRHLERALRESVAHYHAERPTRDSATSSSRPNRAPATATLSFTNDLVGYSTATTAPRPNGQAPLEAPDTHRASQPVCIHRPNSMTCHDLMEPKSAIATALSAGSVFGPGARHRQASVPSPDDAPTCNAPRTCHRPRAVSPGAMNNWLAPALVERAERSS